MSVVPPLHHLRCLFQVSDYKVTYSPADLPPTPDELVDGGVAHIPRFGAILVVVPAHYVNRGDG